MQLAEHTLQTCHHLKIARELGAKSMELQR
jgi:hypothetical protein